MHGYYAYPGDGYAYWGIGLYRSGELPVAINDNVYRSTAAVRVRYLRMKRYADDKKSKLEQAARDAEAKAKVTLKKR